MLKTKRYKWSCYHCNSTWYHEDVFEDLCPYCEDDMIVYTEVPKEEVASYHKLKKEKKELTKRLDSVKVLLNKYDFK